MSLKNIEIKDSYESDINDILHDFYIPVLKESIEYYRLSGFFSSQALAIAARGISGLIRNGGRMKIVVSPELSNEDLNVIKQCLITPEKYIEDKFLYDFNKLEDKFIKDHLYALGWMIANNKLEIKIAIPYGNNGKPLTFEEIQRSSIFHIKVGILKDFNGNMISFSGSLNESAMGWLGGYVGNVEEFKVFKNWDPSKIDCFNSDIQKFNRFWNNNSPNVKVIDIPEAIRRELIKNAPKKFEQIDIDKWNINHKKSKSKVKLFDHQNKAISYWIENRKKGILEMATGTGKTITAIECLNIMAKEYPSNLITIITIPSSHLLMQWKNNLEKFLDDSFVYIIADGDHDWRRNLEEELISQSLPYKDNLNIIILVTHITFSSNDFTDMMNRHTRGLNTFLIADEMHWLGAEKLQNGLLDIYKYRLGLSATPSRWFDDDGTRVLCTYFYNDTNQIPYSFNLEDALTKINPDTNETYLTKYYYMPIFVHLMEDELEKYNKLTQSYLRNVNKVKNDPENKEYLERILFERSKIIKNAREKDEMLIPIIEDIKNRQKDVDHTIIYCSNNQIGKTLYMLSRYKDGNTYHAFTMNESTKPSQIYSGISEREFILKKFDEGEFKFLVAMKCLDEGVDIPSAKNAILMANDGNPRQYIQRLGRILRRYYGKNVAYIYDLIVIPDFKNINKETINLERSILQKELYRYQEIANLALNNTDATNKIYHIVNMFNNL